MPYTKLKHIVPGLISVSIAAISTFISFPSYALTSITWTLNNFTFSDGTTASGTFTTNYNTLDNATAGATFTNSPTISSSIVTNSSGSLSSLNTVYVLSPQNPSQNLAQEFVLEFYNSSAPTKGIVIDFGTTLAAFQSSFFPASSTQDSYRIDFNSNSVVYSGTEYIGTTPNSITGTIPNFPNSLRYFVNGQPNSGVGYITGSVFTVIGVPFEVPGGSTMPVIGGIFALFVMRGVKKSASLNNHLANSVTND